MNYTTSVFVKNLETKQWLKDFCFPEKFEESCKACPYYGKVWSCPPGTPRAPGYLERYQDVFVIGVKVIYDPCESSMINTAEKADIARADSYGKVKRMLLEILLIMEKEFPEAITLAAGRCELCNGCSRLEHNSCRWPERKRYSFTSFGFDFVKLANELFHLELLWSAEGLPEYNVAMAALLYNK